MTFQFSHNKGRPPETLRLECFLNHNIRNNLCLQVGLVKNESDFHVFILIANIDERNTPINLHHVSRYLLL